MRRAALIVGSIALVHFAVTLPLQLYLGLSFSTDEYRFLQPLLDFLTYPVKVLVRSGGFNNLSRPIRNGLITAVCLANSFVYAMAAYGIVKLFGRIRRMGRIEAGSGDGVG